MNYFSTFTGIGGFELGINAVDTSAKFVGYSEIDKYAISVYEKHFKGVENYGDITKIKTEELPDFDCLVGGFPCQAFSIAGKRRGFEDTRGTLFFDLARILRAKQPQYFVFENVKGLLSHNSGATFRTIISAIDELGYDCQWQVLNSKNHGVPQNRERVIIVGHLRGTPGPEVFPFLGSTKANIKVDSILDSDTWRKRNESIRRVYDPSGIAPTIPTGTGDGHLPKIITSQPKYGNGERSVEYKTSDISPTIRATHHKSDDNQPKVIDFDEQGIRRFTPLECERLQAFPDNWTKYGLGGVLLSDSQRYKMCGNAVTTNVIQAVFERIFAS